ncbi:MAG: MerR family transcriptional regulator [Tannerellaceae bacterium]|nr:MerR family transcriptional regulator [Tannerellaceae bacterium]
MNRLVTIGEAPEILGVSITTLRRWDKDEKLR